MADMVDYPSGAPLPKFSVARVQGQRVVGEVASVQFEVSILNFQEIMDWFFNNGYGVDYASELRLHFASPHTDESIRFVRGVGVVEPNSIALRNFGQWNTLNFGIFAVSRIVNDQYLDVFPYGFSSPVYFCDVYVPSNLALMPTMTDLPFRTQMAYYPSDAPSPKFQVSGVRGRGAFFVSPPTQVIDAIFVTEASNYQDVIDWVSQNYPQYDRLTFRSSNGELISFDENGIISSLQDRDVSFREESFGKWNRLEFTEMINPSLVFKSPIYFCDVYVPPFSQMPYSGSWKWEWTDLLFKQEPSTYKLNIVAGAGGTTDPAPGLHEYPALSTVTVDASASEGYTFNHWELDGSVRTERPINILIDSDHNLVATFTESQPPKPPTWFDRWWKTVEDYFKELGLPVPPKPPQPPFEPPT